MQNLILGCCVLTGRLFKAGVGWQNHGLVHDAGVLGRAGGWVLGCALLDSSVWNMLLGIFFLGSVFKAVV